MYRTDLSYGWKHIISIYTFCTLSLIFRGLGEDCDLFVCILWPRDRKWGRMEKFCQPKSGCPAALWKETLISIPGEAVTDNKGGEVAFQSESYQGFHSHPVLLFHRIFLWLHDPCTRACVNKSSWLEDTEWQSSECKLKFESNTQGLSRKIKELRKKWSKGHQWDEREVARKV